MRGVTRPSDTQARSQKFLLTRLMRGVTPARALALAYSLAFLLTRLMRGVTDRHHREARAIHISTHTPHARRDLKRPTRRQNADRFLLTRLMRGVTPDPNTPRKPLYISTHTPHARRDVRSPALCTIMKNFYSHASCEA